MRFDFHQMFSVSQACLRTSDSNESKAPASIELHVLGLAGDGCFQIRQTTLELAVLASSESAEEAEIGTILKLDRPIEVGDGGWEIMKVDVVDGTRFPIVRAIRGQRYRTIDVLDLRLTAHSRFFAMQSFHVLFVCRIPGTPRDAPEEKQ